MTKTVAIIGAGPSGLSSIKSCLDEGFQPTCFEQSHTIGGLWRYNPEKGAFSSVFHSTTINTSKEMMCFSDFPIPEHYAQCMHNSKVVQYFEEYAHRFDLMRYIEFNCLVKTVEPVSGGTEGIKNLKWRVVVVDKNDEDRVVTDQLFDAVMVCSGHHSKPHDIHNVFPGFEKFKGITMHSHDYKTPAGMENKNIVVVGIGNSAVDLAVELSRVGKQVYLSTRSGACVFPRFLPFLVPADHLVNTRWGTYIPQWVGNHVFSLISRFCVGDSSRYGMKPDHGLYSSHPTINGELMGRVGSGTLEFKPNISEIKENSVVFTDGTEVPADAIFFCTGYQINFPFLKVDIQRTSFDGPEDAPQSVNDISLYKYVFHPDYGHTLGMIGLVQVVGAIIPHAEMLARLFTYSLSQDGRNLPSPREQMEDIRRRKTEMRKRYKKSPRHTIQVDYVDHLDEISAMLPGVRPSILELAKTNPSLAWKLFFGPVSPIVYRIQGHGKWAWAEQAYDDLYWNTLSLSNYAPTAAERKSIRRRNEILFFPLILFVYLLSLIYKFVSSVLGSK